jgi:hypothetical protein
MGGDDIHGRDYTPQDWSVKKSRSPVGLLPILYCAAFFAFGVSLPLLYPGVSLANRVASQAC